MELNKIHNINAISRDIKINPDKPSIEKSISQAREFQKNGQQSSEKRDLQEIKAAVAKANRLLFKNNTHLKFEAHDPTDFLVIKIVDDKTGEVVKEIPSEKMLDLITKMQEVLGVFVDEKR